MDILSRSLQQSTNPDRKLNLRPIVLFAVGYGIGVYFFSRFFSGIVGICIFILLLIGLFYLAFHKKNYFLLILPISIIIAVLRTSIAVPNISTDGNYCISGRICEAPLPDSVIIDNVCIGGKQFNCRVAMQAPHPYMEYGSFIEATADIHFVANLPADTCNNMLSKGIGANAENVTLSFTKKVSRDLYGHTIDIRLAMENTIDKTFKNASIVKGILLGIKDDIDKSVLENIRTSGVAHLLALSGLHVSALVSAISFLLSKLKPIYKFIIILLFLFFYCMLAAFPASLMRASIMSAVSMLSVLVGRKNDMLNSLSVAFIIILLINPYNLFSVGFALSFLAVFGIILITPLFYRLLPRGRIKSEKLRGTILSPATSIGATLATMPTSAYVFGNVCIYSVVTNIAAIPLASIAVITAFFGTLVAFISDKLTVPFAFITDTALDFVKSVSEITANFPYASIKIDHISPMCCLTFIVFLIIASEYIFLQKSQKLLICALLLFSVILFFT